VLLLLLVAFFVLFPFSLFLELKIRGLAEADGVVVRGVELIDHVGLDDLELLADVLSIFVIN
jgi:hypothetical protein